MVSPCDFAKNNRCPFRGFVIRAGIGLQWPWRRGYLNEVTIAAENNAHASSALHAAGGGYDSQWRKHAQPPAYPGGLKRGAKQIQEGVAKRAFHG
jgi:hypothetical protein